MVTAVSERLQRVADFDYELPRELVAARPAVPRDSARLLEIGADLRDLGVRDLPGLLRRGDVLVFNDTRVIPARLVGRRPGAAAGGPAGARGEARIEVTLHKPLAGGLWHAFAKPAKRLRPGDRIEFGPGFSAEVAEKRAEGEVTLGFGLDEAALADALARHGAMPLPPYIPRPEGPDSRDREDYQTVYAARPGAVAAPTAGLHFTPRLLSALSARGVTQVFITLHVGAGTFLPVKAEYLRDHRMHAEAGGIAPQAAEAINAARRAGGRVVAVGTTVLRLLESAVDERGRVRPFHGETDIFITPGFRFRAVDLLLTNFHLPRSTLFMLVCAFGGTERMRRAYAHAIRRRYRFYSYGDCCLIHPREAR